MSLTQVWIFMDSFELYKKLITIPFLKIGEVDYLQDLKAALEKSKAKTFHDFKTFSPILKKPISFNLDVLSLYDFNDNPESGHTSTTILGKDKSLDFWSPCIPTTLAKEYPYFQKAIDDFVETPSRCRLSKLPAGEKVLWHAHQYLHSKPLLTEIILHLPIQASAQVSAEIKDRNGNLYQTHFKEGEVWYLNTWLPHSFNNKGDQDRYHIWYNAYLTNGEKETINKKLHGLLTDAVINYEGPFLT